MRKSPLNSLSLATRSSRLSMVRVGRRRRSAQRLGPLGAVAAFGIALGALWAVVFTPLVSPPGPIKPTAMLPASVQAGAKPSEQTNPADAGSVEAEPSTEGLKLAVCAAEQMAAGVRFSADYYRMKFPGGDVPAEVGTSADLLVRCLRHIQVDLQEAIPRDRQLAPDAYPTKRWKKARPDPNVDHRRLANIHAWLMRHAEARSTRIDDKALRDYLPGDIVMWSLKDGRTTPDHAGIVTAERDTDGAPFVIDIHPNVGGCSRTHKVTTWGVRAHFRLPKPAPEPAMATAG